MLKVLLVDDDDDFCEAVGRMIEGLGHSVTRSLDLAGAVSAISETIYDHILLDFMLPDGSGLHLIDKVKDQHIKSRITLISGHPSVKSIMAGLCGPGIDYLIKPIRFQQIKDLFSGVSTGSVEPRADMHFGCLIGESAAMRRLYSMIERVASSDANVMLMGESGAGKELVAQAIHMAAGVRGKLVAANCGAFSKELIGSELFGHEKGAFTGAIARKIGVFEQADGGSLFLDEVTEMPMDIQPNLLRVLETNRIIRVGGTQDIPVSCRVISATNRPPEKIAEDNVLREDLYFRLAVFPIEIPPLRERSGDISVLAKFFLEELNEKTGTEYEINAEQLARLESYEWPGNVRELRHLIHRSYILTGVDEQYINLPKEIASPFSGSSGNQIASVKAGQKIDEVEKELIKVTLEKLDGDKPKAAQMLGISLKTLYNRLNKYGDDF